MSKFHVNENGEARPCSAQVQCRFGADAEHFDNKEGAQKFAEEKMAEEFNGGMTPRKLKSEKEDFESGARALAKLMLEASDQKADDKTVDAIVKERRGRSGDADLEAKRAAVRERRRQWIKSSTVYEDSETVHIDVSKYIEDSLGSDRDGFINSAIGYAYDGSSDSERDDESLLAVKAENILLEELEINDEELTRQLRDHNEGESRSVKWHYSTSMDKPITERDVEKFYENSEELDEDKMDDYDLINKWMDEGQEDRVEAVFGAERAYRIMNG